MYSHWSLDFGRAQHYIRAIMAGKKSDPNNKVVAENRRARYNYAVEDTLECGIMLEGSEVKSLRIGGVNIAESYASVEDGGLYLINAHIPSIDHGRTFGHEERRKRKLLVHKREYVKFANAIGREGMTLVPLKMYFNDKGRAKLLIGVAKGKKMSDKRDTEKARDWKREQGRILRDRG